ncbi:hypothetical protein FHS16_000846 [Paenibacillus endophyticus]|uniref:Fibronectin type III domain-containing protein n=1 Tax=Paenibacillus endophyticus TaxID=1294268 RepID=A0A7W5C403_9BACL|nr:hypothetical protein [Paenibacillus endophyticus]MBB3150812.1 hypothetical protein [Paenibacillus endophyticus]
MDRNRSLNVVWTVRDDIPNHAISGYTLRLDHANGSSVYSIPSLSPGEEWRFVLPANETSGDGVDFDIRRPTGFSVLDGRLSIAEAE